jgi:hypothetical protein
MVIDIEDTVLLDFWTYVKLGNFIYRFIYEVIHMWFSGSYFNFKIRIILKTYLDVCPIKVFLLLFRLPFWVYILDHYHVLGQRLPLTFGKSQHLFSPLWENIFILHSSNLLLEHIFDFLNNKSNSVYFNEIFVLYRFNAHVGFRSLWNKFTKCNDID